MSVAPGNPGVYPARTYHQALRVLVVEDRPGWQRDLQSMLADLAAEGIRCEVQAEVDYAGARDALLQQYFDLAIVDLVLHQGPPGEVEDWEGLWLLQDLYDLGLQGETPVVILTQFDPVDVASMAFTKFGVIQFLSKELGLPDIKNSVSELLLEQRDLGMTCEIQLEAPWVQLVGRLSAARFKQLTAPLPAAEAARELEHLVRRLEKDWSSITIHDMELGHSGAGVARVSHERDGEPLADSLLKYGLVAQIVDEQRGYAFLEPRVANHKTAQLKGSAMGRHLGVLEYNLVGTSEATVVPFERFYRGAHTETVNACLTELFEQTCGSWYQRQSMRHIEELNLETHYAETLHFDRDAISRAYVFKFGPRALAVDTITDIPELPRALIDPVAMLQRGAAELTADSWIAPSHGDLHGGNILVDSLSNSGWLIDFGAAGYGHWARDFASLECCIKYQYVEARDIHRLYEFENALAAPPGPLPDDLADFNDRADLARAVVVIRHVRAIARALLQHCTDLEFERDYNAALYYLSLNYLRLHALLRPQKKRKQQVLIGAALAYERIS